MPIMKKILCVAMFSPVVCAGHAAAADLSGVRLFGVADAAVSYSNGGDHTVKLNSGMGSTSRFGLTGTEDLGGGYTLSFLLESAVGLDTGAAGGTTLQRDSSLFNREANITLGSPRTGYLKLGRQYPAMMSLALDPFVGVSGFSPFTSIVGGNSDLGNGASMGDSRISNAISYTSMNLGGVTSQVLYAPRERNDAGYHRTADYGIEAHFAHGPLLYLGGQYNVVYTDPTALVPAVKNIWSGVGVQYQLGASTLGYSLNVIAPETAGSRVAQNHMLSLVYQSQPRHTVQLALMYRNVAGHHALNSFTAGFGYSYNFSKTVSVYTRIGGVLNNSEGISTLAATPVSAAGNDVRVLALGLRQRF